jgi:transposase
MVFMKTIIKRDRKEFEKRRFKAGKLFASGYSQADVAKKFGVTTAAVCKWYQRWKKDGQPGLLSKGATGAKPKLTPENRKALKKIILLGAVKAGYQTDFWTLRRIQGVTKKKIGVTLSAASVWRAVLALGFSCQKPERLAKERNKKAIVDWKLKEFPKQKKMGGKT